MDHFVAFTTAFLSIQRTFADPIPNYKLGCFADLGPKSDRKTDVVLHDGSTIYAFNQHIVDDSKKSFELYANLNAGGTVQSVSAFDRNRNGVSDLFVVTERTTLTGSGSQFKVWTDVDNSFTSSMTPIKLANKHILVHDANGDFEPDVFGLSSSYGPGIWFGPHFKDSEFKRMSGMEDILMETASFIDLDQDCRADLVYMNTAKTKVKMLPGGNWQDRGTGDGIIDLIDLRALGIKAGDIQGRLLFADINRDGAMDIIIPSNNLNVHFFIQKQNFGFKDICTTKRKSLKDFDKSFNHITMKVTAPTGYRLDKSLPFIVQDIDLDLNVEIVAVLKRGARYHPEVFVGTLPRDGLKDGDAIKVNEMNKNVKSMIHKVAGIEGQHHGTSTIEDLIFYHSGKFPFGLHFMIKTATKWVWMDMESVLDDTNHGFLSVAPLNDADPAQKRYGGAMPGAMIKAFFRSRSGADIFLTAGTFYQTNSGHHMLPFEVFGLNNPDSYIEKLVIAYSFYDQEDRYSVTQPGVPPNSQIVLFAHPRNDRSRWRLQTFLAPYITPLTLALIITGVMGLLGGLWLHLELKARREDAGDEHKVGANTTDNFFF